MVIVAPSILSADFNSLLADVQRMEHGGADWLHIDVMDGHFVPNITMGPLVLDALKGKTKLFMDAHLMVEHPQNFLQSFSEAGADLITVHAETCPHLHRVVQAIRKLGCRAGVALNPATPSSQLQYILEDLDLVLLMTVNPGFGGQEFIPAVIPKIRELALEKERRGLSLKIQVDGGINAQTAPLVVEAGADVLVAGSALFRNGNPQELIHAFKQLPQVIKGV